MNNITQFWGITSLYSIGYLSIRAVSFLLLPLYTNLLTTLEAGILFIVYTIIAFLNTLYSHGMDSALLKYFNKNNHESIISTSIIYSLIYSFLLSIFIYFIYYLLGFTFYLIIYNGKSIQIIYLIFIILICDMLSSRCITIVRLLENPLYYLSVGLANVITSLFLNIYFINTLQMGFDGAILSLTLVSCLQLFLLLPIIIKNVRFKKFDNIILKKMLSFSLPFLPASIFFILIEMSDRWMIGWLSNIENVGLYGAGYKIGSIVLLLVNSFNINWQPYYLKNNEKKKDFGDIGTKFLLFLIIICTLLSILWSLLFTISLNSYFLIGKEFWEGGSIIPIIALSYFFYGVFILQMPSIYIKNKQNWAPLIWGIGASLNFLGNYFLIPIMGFYGAAIATLISYMFMSLFLLYKNNKWLPIRYNMLTISLISIISFLVYYYQVNNSFSMSWIMIFIMIYLLIVYCIIKISKK